MEVVLGIIVIIVVVAVIFGDGSSSSAPTPNRQPVRPTSAPPRRHVAPPPVQRAAHQREIERHRRGDAAFFDGVVFGHYFLDGYGQDDEDAEEAGAWDDSFGDDYDDGMYD